MARRKKTEKRELSHEDIPRNTRATAGGCWAGWPRQWWKLLLVAGAALLSSASFTAIPLAVGMASTGWWTPSGPLDGSRGVVETAAGALGLPVLLVAAAALFSSLMSYVQQYIIATVGEELTLSLRQDVSAKLNRLPLRYFDGHKTGDIMSRVTNDLEKVSSVMQVGLMQLVSSVFTIALAAAAMVMLSPRLFLVVLVSLALSMTATGYVSALAQRAYGGNMAAMGALTGKVEELYAGNRVVKVFNRQAAMLEEAEALNEAQFRAQRRAQFADYAIYPAIRVLGQLGFIATAVLGGGMAPGRGYHPGHCAGLFAVCQPDRRAGDRGLLCHHLPPGRHRGGRAGVRPAGRGGGAARCGRGCLRDHAGPRGVSPCALRLHTRSAP